MNRLFLSQKILLLVLMLVQGSVAYGDELDIFVDNSYTPYMYGEGDGDAQGLYPKLLEEVIDNTGFDSKIVAVPWKRALLYGGAGVAAVGGAYKNEERLKIYDYSAPLYEEKMVIFVNKAKRFEFNGIDDLAGKTIGVNRGWSYGQTFDDAREAGLFEVNVRADFRENFKMLELGRIDCLILDQLSGESYIEYLGLGDKIVSLPVPFSLNNGYLIIPKEMKMTEFLKKFDASLEAMRASGSYQKLVQEFIQGTISSYKALQ